jgi:7-cyano-7-deazaguanine synthase
MNAPRAVVLLSGGIDSAVALFWAREKGLRAWALEFEYHLRPARERRCAAALAERAGAPRITAEVPFLREASDLPAAGIGAEHLQASPRGYIPARNLVFYSIAAYYAEALDAGIVVGGHNRDDAARFPDASPGFFDSFAPLASRALWSREGRRLEILLPLAELGKAQTVAKGVELAVPFGDTWSCYEDRDRPCGRCPSCAERAEAFAAVGAPDPLLS